MYETVRLFLPYKIGISNLVPAYKKPITQRGPGHIVLSPTLKYSLKRDDFLPSNFSHIPWKTPFSLAAPALLQCWLTPIQLQRRGRTKIHISLSMGPSSIKWVSALCFAMEMLLSQQKQWRSYFFLVLLEMEMIQTSRKCWVSQDNEFHCLLFKLEAQHGLIKQCCSLLWKYSCLVGFTGRAQ